MIYFLILVSMATLSRLSGSGFGKQWGVSWLPELLFSFVIGISCAWGVDSLFAFIPAIIALIIGTAISYAGKQAATWGALRWEKHEPNAERTATIKPVVDWIAKRFGWKIGDEGYSWIWMGVKGFIIGLPIGGLPLAILYPLGYEIGSHAKGRVSFDPHAVSEIAAGAGAGLAIVIFIEVVKCLT